MHKYAVCVVFVLAILSNRDGLRTSNLRVCVVFVLAILSNISGKGVVFLGCVLYLF